MYYHHNKKNPNNNANTSSPGLPEHEFLPRLRRPVVIERRQSRQHYRYSIRSINPPSNLYRSFARDLICRVLRSAPGVHGNERGGIHRPRPYCKEVRDAIWPSL